MLVTGLITVKKYIKKTVQKGFRSLTITKICEIHVYGRADIDIHIRLIFTSAK